MAPKINFGSSHPGFDLTKFLRGEWEDRHLAVIRRVAFLTLLPPDAVKPLAPLCKV